MEYQDKEFCLEVWGPLACFTRPEFKIERVSYDFITPSAARAIFEAIFWKPAIHWQVTKIEVLNEIKWTSIRRNEVNPEFNQNSTEGGAIYIDDDKSRQQKNTLMLRDVRYRIYAKLIFIPRWKRKESKNPLIDEEERDILHTTENPGKYNAIFQRRASKGQCFTQPYLGCREFPAKFTLIESDTSNEKKPIPVSRDFGWMFYDLDYDYNVDYDERSDRPHPSLFYHAVMNNGVVTIDKNQIKG